MKKKKQVKYNFYMLTESMKRTNVYTSLLPIGVINKYITVYMYIYNVLQCTSPIDCSKVDVMK